ncbi:TonB-dependent copper receptor [Luminiphilus syltensis NOR5-1B]|uniref:TonB-dependent copper receptor n=1 Tax=Luminiphilus syltensis NOR5-1B TaxID=565045 RepID=B8KWM8_9GAMM|nr:TonB-dependent copper receptor [Luminiphilus syltensis]EED35105.1 TonB-dependent copper receptor [Luminiphilus syltensis NOR5-1B]
MNSTLSPAFALCLAFAGSMALAQDDSSKTSPDAIESVSVVAQAMPPTISRKEAADIAPGRETGELLRDSLGLSGSRMGGHGTDPSIRGLSQNRINVLIDGAYIHGGCPNRMDPPTSYAPSGNFESLTVIRGMQTLQYGGGGPGGTILFERRTERFGHDLALRGNLSAGYRSNSETQSLNGDIAAGNATGFARLLFGVNDAGNFEDGDGERIRSSYEDNSIAAIVGFYPSADSRIDISFDRQQTKDALFAGAGMDSPDATNRTWQIKAENSAGFGPLSAVYFSAYHSDVSHLMDNFSLRPAGMMRAFVPSQSVTAGGRLVADFTVGTTEWKVGSDIQHNNRDARRSLARESGTQLNSVLWPDATIGQWGVFAEAIHPLDNQSRVITGLRYDRIRSEIADASVDPPGMALSPSALYDRYYGLATESEDTDDNLSALLRYERELGSPYTSGYVAISQTMRAADATERYLASNGATPSSRWVGNPGIDSERHRSLEIGLLQRKPRGSFEASLFYNRVDDYILRDRFTATNDNATIYRNVDAALFGGEAQLSRAFGSAWRATVGVAYVHAENTSDDRAIAQTPPLSLNARLEFQEGPWVFSGEMLSEARQSRVDLNSATGIPGQGLDIRQTPGWSVINLMGRFEASDTLTLEAGVDNLLNRNYSQHLNRGNAFDPTQIQVNEPGRAFWARANLTF